MKAGGIYRWYVAFAFFLFLVFHQADRFIISGIVPALMEEFGVGYAEMGLVFTASILVATLLYPVWGYLYDRYSRRLLVSLAAMIWGSTTWLNALARSFQEFFVTRLATGIDDAAPPGIYSMVADYFEPEKRSRAMGLVNASAPLGAMIGSALALLVGMKVGWKLSFYITGTIGILVGLLIYATVRDIPRGASEPELRGVLSADVFKVRVGDLKQLLRIRSLVFLYLQGFFGVFPWNALTYWVITYLIEERGVAEEQILGMMALWLTAMILGNVAAGFLADWAYRKSRRGRAVFGGAVVYLSALLIYLTMTSPDFPSFATLGMLTAFEIPMAGPAVSAAIADVTEPELRSSANAALRLFENSGSALSPLAVGLLAESIGLGYAITVISVSTWITCGAFFTILALIIPGDMQKLREVLARRAATLSGAGASP